MNVLASILLVFSISGVASIHVEVDGDAREVLAYRDGAIVARAPVREGRALLTGLREGHRFDLRAIGEGTASDVVRGVRAVASSREGSSGPTVSRQLSLRNVKHSIVEMSLSYITQWSLKMR